MFGLLWMFFLQVFLGVFVLCVCEIVVWAEFEHLSICCVSIEQQSSCGRHKDGGEWVRDPKMPPPLTDPDHHYHYQHHFHHHKHHYQHHFHLTATKMRRKNHKTTIKILMMPVNKWLQRRRHSLNPVQLVDCDLFCKECQFYLVHWSGRNQSFVQPFWCFERYSLHCRKAILKK